MRYADFRDRIKSGDIVAYSFRRGWLTSWYAFKVNLVRLVQRSEYSHVGFALVQDDRVWLVDSVTPVVRKIPLSDDLPCFIVTGNGLTEGQRLKAMSFVGKGRYSQWDAILAFLGLNDKTDGRLSCAEFINIVFDLPCKATPAEVVNYLLDRGSTLVKVTA